MIRAIIQQVIEGAIKRFSGAGRANETITNRESFQHYGFSSRPLSGAEGIVIAQGNHVVMIAEDDRRYRIGIEAGEVCLYTDEGDHIRFKRGKEIYIKSGNKLTAEVTNDVNITAKRIKATATESARIESPAITLKTDSLSVTPYTGGTPAIAMTGNITLTGSISATGSITDTTGNTNHHSHS